MKRMKYVLVVGIWFATIQASPLLQQHDDQLRAAVSEIVLSMLGRYTRPTTTLDYNAYDGYYSFLLSQLYHNNTSVMLEADYQGILLNNCLSNPELTTLILLKHDASLADLKRLGECEHFDMTIAVHGLNTLLEHWQLALDFLLNSADHCLLLIPLIAHDQYSPETIREMCAYIEARGAKLLKTVNNEQNSGDAWALYLRSHPKPFGGRVHWNRKKLLKKGSYIIKSDFSGKKLYKPTTKKWVRWQRGINLRTFLALQGSYPTKEMVLTQLRTFQGSTHNDLLPCNMVIQGRKIIAIDFDDPRRHLNPNIGFNRLMKVYG